MTSRPLGAAAPNVGASDQMLSLLHLPSALIAPAYRRHGTVNMLADPPIADLSGGEDADRNAAVASLKSLFYPPDPRKTCRVAATPAVSA